MKHNSNDELLLRTEYRAMAPEDRGRGYLSRPRVKKFKTERGVRREVDFGIKVINNGDLNEVPI